MREAEPSPRQAPFGETATGGSEGKCPTKGIDLRAKALSGADAKRIGSRPAVELRFNPRAAFLCFVDFFGGFPDTLAASWHGIIP